MESLHSPLHGPAFIPDLKENLDTSPRKKTKQNTNSEPETRLATDQCPYGFRAGAEKLLPGPDNLGAKPGSRHLGSEAAVSLRGGRAAAGAPHPGGAHPRGPQEGAPRPPQGLTARNAPDRESNPPSARAALSGTKIRRCRATGKRARSQAPITPGSHERGAPESTHRAPHNPLDAHFLSDRYRLITTRRSKAAS